MDYYIFILIFLSLIGLSLIIYSKDYLLLFLSLFQKDKNIKLENNENNEKNIEDSEKNIEDSEKKLENKNIEDNEKNIEDSEKKLENKNIENNEKNIEDSEKNIEDSEKKLEEILIKDVILDEILGGYDKKIITNEDKKLEKLIINDNAKFVFDGHNFIHRLKGNSLSVNEFKKTLIKISDVLTNSLPKNELHIVIKNPNDDILKEFNYNKLKHSISPKDSKNIKKNVSVNLYFDELISISKQFPLITYHLAFGKEPVKSKLINNKHYLKGRDDFLTIYLAKDGYIISQDKFKDFKYFNNIKPFIHLSVINGITQPKEKIKPKEYFDKLNKPNIGNRINYEIISNSDAKKIKVSNGIYVNNNISSNEPSCMYIII